MQNSAQNKPTLEKEYTLPEIDGTSTAILETKQAPVIIIFGEMGVGKTTLIKALAKQLGVRDAVSSPTFALVNEYLDAKDNSIYHFDLYRLQHEEEALDIGIEEYFDSGSICLVEWPEKIINFLPANFGVLVLQQVEGVRTARFYPNCTTQTMPQIIEA